MQNLGFFGISRDNLHCYQSRYHSGFSHLGTEGVERGYFRGFLDQVLTKSFNGRQAGVMLLYFQNQPAGGALAVLSMDIQLLLSLHRHWVWADRMKELFEFYLAEEWPIPEEHLGPTSPYWISSIFTCMCLWYGLLYVTCDGIEEHAGVKVTSIAPSYNKISFTLRRFRNAMFHVQASYWSDKLMNVIRDDKIPDDIREVHKLVGAWIEKKLLPYTKKTEG
jgi:hypothetical protein